MKKILYAFILIMSSTTILFGQQEHQFTQFMHTKLAINPAYAGAEGVPSLVGLYRNQWMGFEGRPQTKLISFHSNLLPNKVGFGLTIANYEIGLFDTWSGTMAYSYRIEFNEKTDLRLGLHASIKYLGIDFDNNDIVTIDPTDESILENTQLNEYNANFGFGGYFQFDNMYLGLSVPNIFRNEIGITDISGAVGAPLKVAREIEHFYLMAGAKLPIGTKVALQPNVQGKLVQNAPFDLDVNVTAIFNDQVGTGLSYRLGGQQANDTSLGESIDFLLYFKLNNLGIGAAYDFTLTDIADFSSGSLEFVLKYEFRKEQQGMSNPRFFF